MKISFIGAGNMASAIAKGALKKQFIAAENLYFYDIQVKKPPLLHKKLVHMRLLRLKKLLQ